MINCTYIFIIISFELKFLHYLKYLFMYLFIDVIQQYKITSFFSIKYLVKSYNIWPQNGPTNTVYSG